MSSTEPMWYCHECHAEMRPLMVPDPVCASCRGSFVEKIEDPTNDPREFSTGGGPGGARGEDGLDPFLVALQTLLNRGMGMQQRPSPPLDRSPLDHPPPRPQGSPRVTTFQIRGGSLGPRQTSIVWGSAPSPGSSPNFGSPPTMSEFIRRAPDATTNEPRGGPQISGPLFAQYLMSLLGQTDHPMLPLFMGSGSAPESGRMGDYVFSQEALDQIITQIMEGSNAHRPVPATEEVTQKLPREVLEEGSILLTKDCAVCKDQFQLATEDPDEQIVITLPCNHPFHQPCILPWLKSSGTCPVCRHALVPQPDQDASSNNPSTSSPSQPNNTNTSNPPPRARSRSPPRTSSGSESFVPGIISTLFGNLTGHNRHSSRSSMDSSSSTSTSTSTPSRWPNPRDSSSSASRPRDENTTQNQDRNRNRDNRGPNGRPHLPGQWADDSMDLD